MTPNDTICFVLKEPIFKDTFYVVFSVKDIQCQIFLNGVMTLFLCHFVTEMSSQPFILIWLIFRK